MGLSFRKSVQILPGVKLNISKSGIGISAGVTGLHASINSKGQIRGTASLPGTGLRYTKSTKVQNLIPGMKEKEEAKKQAEKEAKAAEKKAAAAEAKKQKATAQPAATPEAVATAPAAAATAQEESKTSKTAEAKAKKQLAQTIVDLYAIADKSIEWVVIKNSSANPGYEEWDYLKARAGKVLDGDIDTYLEIINDINPFAELIELGSQFSCGTDSPMKMAVECVVNSEQVLGEYKDDKELLEDYVAGVAIKSARDLFAILPLWQVEITCVENEKTVLNAKFVRDSFEALNFDKIDASDTVKKLGGIIAV